MWPFLGQMGREKGFYAILPLEFRCVSLHLQLKAVPFFIVYVFLGTLESFTHDIKKTITTVTYNVIICAVEFAPIIKHLPSF